MAGPSTLVEDEIERATQAMRARYLLGCEQIAAGLTALEACLADAVGAERRSLIAAAAAIAATQEGLKARMQRLPAPAWDRFKAVVSVLKAQQEPLAQLGLLVREHVLPQQISTLAAATGGLNGPDFTPTATGPPWALDGELPPHEDPRTARRSRMAPSRAERRPAREVSGSLLSSARTQSAAILRAAAAVVVLGVFSHFVIPIENKVAELAAKFAQMALPLGEGGAPPPSAQPSPREASPPRLAPSPPPMPAPAPSVASVPPPMPTATARSSSLPQPAASNTAALPAQSGHSEASAGSMRASDGEELFVPVVFTHRDRATAVRALGELRMHYRQLLRDRQGEIQPVDLGEKGVWHRLVLLPPGSRPEVTKLCDQLLKEGYDRCWVKAY